MVHAFKIGYINIVGEKMKLVIIGGGPAAVIAAFTAKSIDSNVDVILVKNEKGVFVKCEAPYNLAGMPKLEDAVLPDEMIKEKGINIVYGEVKEINRNKKSVKTENEEINYDKLIVATGARSWVPPIPGIENALTLRDADDVKKIKEKIAGANKVAIIGAGAIGVEIAAQLKKIGKEVTTIELMPTVLPGAYDEEFIKKAEAIIEKEVNLMLSTKTLEIKEGKVITDKGEINADAIIAVTGVRANSELAKNAGLEVGKYGVTINEYMQTSDENIFAAGDCTDTRIKLATNAVMQGKAAALNALGVKTKRYKETGAMISDIFGYAIGRVGKTEKEAGECKVGTANSFSKYQMHPGAEPITVKLIFDKEDKLVGAQIWGKEGVAERINLLSLAIAKEMKKEEIAQLDYCAHPSNTPLPFSEPIVMAAENVK